MHSFRMFHGLGLFATLILVVVPSWKIFTKAGFAGAWALLMLVPLVNLIVLWVFAFSNWPARRIAP